MSEDSEDDILPMYVKAHKGFWGKRNCHVEEDDYYDCFHRCYNAEGDYFIQ